MPKLERYSDPLGVAITGSDFDLSQKRVHVNGKDWTVEEVLERSGGREKLLIQSEIEKIYQKIGPGGRRNYDHRTVTHTRNFESFSDELLFFEHKKNEEIMSLSVIFNSSSRSLKKFHASFRNRDSEFKPTESEQLQKEDYKSLYNHLKRFLAI